MTNDALLRALGWVLAHSIWQATAVALSLLLLLPRLQTVRQRYWVSYSAMLAVFTAAVVTFVWMYEPVQPLEGGITYNVGGNVENTVLFLEQSSLGLVFWQKMTVWLENNHTMVVAIWLLGFSFFLLRLGGGLWS